MWRPFICKSCGAKIWTAIQPVLCPDCGGREFKKEPDKFGLLQTKFNERGEIEFEESNLKGELGWKQLRLPFDF